MGNVNSEIARIEQAKDNIEAAIENCGVDVPDTELISDYATYINKIPEAVFAQFQLAKQGGTDEYIESIEQVNGTISVATGGLASTEASGLMSKEDKTRLNLIAEQSTPIIFGNDTDTLTVWTGSSDRVSSYSEGMSIIFVPKKLGSSSTTLQINDLEPLKLSLKGGIASLLSNTPIQLTLINNMWVVYDQDTKYTLNTDIAIYRTTASYRIWFYSTHLCPLVEDIPGYVVLYNPDGAVDVTGVTRIAIGKGMTTSYLFPLQVKFLPDWPDLIPPGYYIAYFDGKTVHINCDGTIPGKIEKAALAEKVEWNIVTEGGSEIEELETTVDNAQYLVLHNLGSSDRKPETFKPSAVTAWAN
jgi:hypothetical protein